MSQALSVGVFPSDPGAATASLRLTARRRSPKKEGRQKEQTARELPGCLFCEWFSSASVAGPWWAGSEDARGRAPWPCAPRACSGRAQVRLQSKGWGGTRAVELDPSGDFLILNSNCRFGGLRPGALL